MVFSLAVVSLWFLPWCQHGSCPGVGTVLAAVLVWFLPAFCVDAKACLFFLFWCCHGVTSLLLLLLLTLLFLFLLLPQCGMHFPPVWHVCCWAMAWGCLLLPLHGIVVVVVVFFGVVATSCIFVAHVIVVVVVAFSPGMAWLLLGHGMGVLAVGW